MNMPIKNIDILGVEFDYVFHANGLKYIIRFNADYTLDKVYELSKNRYQSYEYNVIDLSLVSINYNEMTFSYNGKTYFLETFREYVKHLFPFQITSDDLEESGLGPYMKTMIYELEANTNSTAYITEESLDDVYDDIYKVSKILIFVENDTHQILYYYHYCISKDDNQNDLFKLYDHNFRNPRVSRDTIYLTYEQDLNMYNKSGDIIKTENIKKESRLIRFDNYIEERGYMSMAHRLKI